MSKMSRYEFMTPEGEALLHIQKFGSWVRYSDYEALAEKYGWTCEAVKVLEKRVESLAFDVEAMDAAHLRDQAEIQRLRKELESSKA